jgi:hypothetical protein
MTLEMSFNKKFCRILSMHLLSTDSIYKLKNEKKNILTKNDQWPNYQSKILRPNAFKGKSFE